MLCCSARTGHIEQCSARAGFERGRRPPVTHSVYGANITVLPVPLGMPTDRTVPGSAHKAAARRKRCAIMVIAELAVSVRPRIPLL